MTRKLCATLLLALAFVFCSSGIFVQAANAQQFADLIETTVTVAGTPANGATLQVTETATNLGFIPSTTFNTNFFLSTNGTTKGAFLGFRTVAALNLGATSTGTTSIKLPLNLAGNYYVMACANGNNAVLETNYTNNCTASTMLTVAGPDLIEASVGIAGTPASGTGMQVVETVTNQGAAAAGASYTNFFLSANGTTKSTFLGFRNVPALAAGSSSGPAATNVTLPSNLAGNYYVIACTNANNAVVESNTANDCTTSAAFAVAGANLTESVSVGQSGVLSGSALKVTDTVMNTGAGAANGSYTNFWLSTNGTTKSTFLGSRNVPAVAAGLSAPAFTSTFTLSSSLSGTYYVMACANANNAIAETNYTDNCGVSSPINITVAAATLVVDPAGLDSVTCGTSVTPCKTITGALANATGKSTILLNPGTYAEQVSINQSLTVTAATKYAAIIRAPATALVPDSNGVTSIVRIGGPANVTLRGLTVQGPGPSGCGSLTYGIFVADANATINDNKVLSIRDSSYSGCQNGVAIRFGSQAFGYTGFMGTISNNVVSDFQKGGIVVDGLNTNVNVTGNTVTGQNTPGVNGQNGIQVSRNAKGTVSNNTVSNAAYFFACPTDAADPKFAMCNQGGTAVGPKNPSAAGILVYDVNGGVTLSNNNVTGNDIGIWISGDGPSTNNGSTNVLVKGNTVSSNRAAGIFIDTTSTSIQIYSNNTHLNGSDALNNVTGFADSSFAQGFGYDLVDENTNPNLNDWGYSGLPGAAPNSFETNWGNGKGALLN